MVSRIFIRCLGHFSVSKGLGSFRFVRAVDCDAPSGLSVPGVPRAPATGAVFQSSRRRKNSLGASHTGQIPGGSSPSWMYPQMTHSHRFIQEEILPEGTAGGQNVHVAGNGVGYGDRMRLPGGWDTEFPATSGSTYPASWMSRGAGRPSSIISALRIAPSTARAGAI